MEEVKRFVRYEFSGVTSDYINGYCEIENDDYLIYEIEGRNIVEVRLDEISKLQVECDELIINGRHVTSVKEFCIVLMKDSGYEYDEEEGFVKR